MITSRKTYEWFRIEMDLFEKNFIANNFSVYYFPYKCLCKSKHLKYRFIYVFFSISNMYFMVLGNITSFDANNLYEFYLPSFESIDFFTSPIIKRKLKFAHRIEIFQRSIYTFWPMNALIFWWFNKMFDA